MDRPARKRFDEQLRKAAIVDRETEAERLVRRKREIQEMVAAVGASIAKKGPAAR